jgi:hypothetical protein
MSDADKVAASCKISFRMWKYVKQLSFPLPEMALIPSYCDIMVKARIVELLGSSMVNTFHFYRY